MKKIVSMLIGLSLVLGTCAFAQDAPKKDDAKKEKKAKKGKKAAEKKADEKK